jgi:hypothetical protein
MTAETVVEWQFDRYVYGRLKAQGVTVHTATEAEAWARANELLSIDGNHPTDELRPRWDPCEKCRKPVYGYVEERCCSGHECGCMGLPVSPCWCDECWAKWESERKALSSELAIALENAT